MTDTFNLQRFIDAQEKMYARALEELHAGNKRTHWIWFVFPQIEGLGRSHTAQRYAIASLEEARAYLAHPILGDRLRECTRAVLAVEGKTAEVIFGYPDVWKFRSCMTLFDRIEPDGVFDAALEKYFGGERDPLTQERIGV